MTRVSMKGPEEMPIYVFRNNTSLSDAHGTVLEEEAICITRGTRQKPREQYVVGVHEGKGRVFKVEPTAPELANAASFPVGAVNAEFQQLLTPAAVRRVADLVDATHGFYEAVMTPENLGFQMAAEIRRRIRGWGLGIIPGMGILITAEEMDAVINTVGDKAQTLLKCRTNLNLAEIGQIHTVVEDIADELSGQGSSDADMPKLL